MTTREFYLERRREEFPAFLRVLKSLPAEQIEFVRTAGPDQSRYCYSGPI